MSITGKLPIEKNYGGRTEDLTEKSFYKRVIEYSVPLLAGLTIFTGIPDWGAPKHTSKQIVKQDGVVYNLKSAPKNLHGLLKMAVAEAQENGTSVYIGEIRLGSKLPDVEWPELHSMFYHELGPKLVKRKFEVSDKYDDSIEVSGTITELTFTVRASIQYKKNGKIIGGDGYEVPRGKLDDVMNGLADRIARDLYKITGSNSKIEEKEPKFASDILHPGVKWQSTIQDGIRIE
jgi:hypothetical protein